MPLIVAALTSLATVTPAAPLEIPGLHQAAGTVDGLEWQFIASSGGCQHEGYPATWCDESDRANLVANQGIEGQMVKLIRDPATKFAAISYFAFSSPAVATALCEEAESRGLRVVAILHDWPVPRGPGSTAYKKIFECAEDLPNVTATRLGTKGGIHHAKIFLTAESENPFDGTELAINSRITATVSSANLSYKAVGLHLENWLWLSGAATHSVMRQNWCYMQALPSMAEGKRAFDAEQKNCLARSESATAAATGTATTDENTTPTTGTIEFLGMPATSPSPKAMKRLLELVDGAESSIRIAAHIFTPARERNTGLLARLMAAANRGVRVELVLDDDTEMVYRKLPGWQRLRVGSDDIEAIHTLASSPVKIRSVDTNERSGQLHHNKFMIFDESTVWTGSGNFTASSLGGRNTEQFYVIRDTGITSAYLKLWNDLWTQAKPFGTL